jgi:hypothetical protein
MKCTTLRPDYQGYAIAHTPTIVTATPERARIYLVSQNLFVRDWSLSYILSVVYRPQIILNFGTP